VSDPARDAAPDLRVRVWDLPVRLFHWLIAVLFGFSWWTAENDRLDWHMLSGYAILALLLFRIFWGFAGSATARFSGFLKGPRAVIGYARNLFRQSESVAFGHNPMGGWSVIALITLLLLQTVLGLFAIDVDGIDGGPLNVLVSFQTGRGFAHLHGRVFNLLLVLTALHVAAVLFYWLFKRENLVAPMITGRRRLPSWASWTELYFAPFWLAAAGLLVAGLLVAGLLVACVVMARF
jgi:cytochrome b